LCDTGVGQVLAQLNKLPLERGLMHKTLPDDAWSAPIVGYWSFLQVSNMTLRTCLQLGQKQSRGMSMRHPYLHTSVRYLSQSHGGIGSPWRLKQQAWTAQNIPSATRVRVGRHTVSCLRNSLKHFPRANFPICSATALWLLRPLPRSCRCPLNYQRCSISCSWFCLRIATGHLADVGGKSQQASAWTMRARK